jgi:ribosomal protein L18
MNFTFRKKQNHEKRRHRESEQKFQGTADMPRLAVYKSNRHLYAQLIDDDEGPYAWLRFNCQNQRQRA